MSEINLPIKLKQRLDDLMNEGQEFVTTYGEDSITWMYTPHGLSEWIIIIQWYEGSNTYDMINLNGTAYKMMSQYFNNTGNPIPGGK